MEERLSERTKSQAYSFSILLSALVLRVVVGLGKPVMSFQQSLIVGLTAVVCLSPLLYRLFYGEDLLDCTRKRVSHGVAMLLAGGLFLFGVALGA